MPCDFLPKFGESNGFLLEILRFTDPSLPGTLDTQDTHWWARFS
jgi:hypothetical protein